MSKASEHIEAREKAGTTGPWETAGVNRWWVVASKRPKHGVIADCGPIAKLHLERGPNADFIAHAREDIPYLLAQLRAAEEKLEALGKELASAPPTDRVRRMDRILQGGD